MPGLAERKKTSAPRSQKGARTRARLLEAAKEVFEEDGFLEARISDISERAGLSHGSFYHYFDSKEEVFREVAVAVEDQLHAPLGGVVLDPESHAPPHERIREALRLHLESYRREARIIGVIEQMARYDKEVNAARMERRRWYAQQVKASIEDLQAHGLADPGLDPTIATATMEAMTTRFTEMWLVQGAVKCGFDTACDQLARMIVNALGLPSDNTGPRGRPRAS